jgi:hypothetical protein
VTLTEVGARELPKRVLPLQRAQREQVGLAAACSTGLMRRKVWKLVESSHSKALRDVPGVGLNRRPRSGPRRRGDVDACLTGHGEARRPRVEAARRHLCVTGSVRACHGEVRLSQPDPEGLGRRGSCGRARRESVGAAAPAVGRGSPRDENSRGREGHRGANRGGRREVVRTTMMPSRRVADLRVGGLRNLDGRRARAFRRHV